MSSNKSMQSLNSLNEKVRDSIPCRIEFIKDLLRGKKLDPLVDFDNTDTEYFMPHGKEENASGESYDTRIVLKKRQLDFLNIIAQIGGKLRYVKSGTTGHTFKGQSVDNFGSFEYAIKVVAFPKKERYGPITDTRRPENAEIMMIKLLSYFIAKKQTPHIVLPIGTFNTDITTFVDLIESNVVAKDNEKYAEFVEKYKNGEFHEDVSILISEWANRGDLLDFIRKYHTVFTPVHWKVMFFQVLSVLAVIQSKYPAFRHNDMKANNVLVHKIVKKNDTFSYRVAKCEYKVPNIGYYVKLWDFDFACIPGIVDNKKVESDWTKQINVTPIQNRYYDIHYFFNTLIKRGFCPEIMTNKQTPQELKDFINRIVPEKYQKTGTKYVHKKGRLLVNDEYLTADDILKFDPYFEEYRVKKNSSTQAQVHTQVHTQAHTQNAGQPKLRKSLSKDNINENVKPMSVPKSKPKISNMPDLTKFLKSSSEEEKPKKVVKRKVEKSSKDNLQLNELIRGYSNEKVKDKQKVKPKSVKPTKKSTKKGKDKLRSRTISEEVRNLDPDIILNYTTSSD